MSDPIDDALQAVSRRKKPKRLSIPEPENVKRAFDPKVAQMAREILVLIHAKKLPRQWSGHMRLLEKSEKLAELTRDERETIMSFYVTHDVFRRYWSVRKG